MGLPRDGAVTVLHIVHRPRAPQDGHCPRSRSHGRAASVRGLQPDGDRAETAALLAETRGT